MYGLSVVLVFVVFVVDGFGRRFVYGYRGGRDWHGLPLSSSRWALKVMLYMVVLRSRWCNW